MSIVPAKGERGIFFGQSGSGKSMGAAYLLHFMPLPIVIYDTKISPSLVACFPGAEIVDGEKIGGLSNAKLDLKRPVTILRPSPEELSDPEGLDDVLFRLYLQKRPITVYCDEAADLCARTGRAYRGMLSLVSRGREQGITFLIGTQRPAWIDNALISEAQHYYIYRLRLPADRKRMEETIGYPLRKPDKHHFYYVDNDSEPAYFSPVPMEVPLHRRNALFGPPKK